MKFSVFLGISLAALLANPCAARADKIVPISDIRPLVEWVEARTNLMLLPRPKIFVSSEALRRLTPAENKARDGQWAEEGGERIAAYRDGTIFIDERYWQPGNEADQSVLVHELVHYAQDVGGQTYACANRREEEAYRLQNRYLAEHGQRPFLDRAALERLGKCG